jgi:hypothetical protein
LRKKVRVRGRLVVDNQAVVKLELEFEVMIELMVGFAGDGFGKPGSSPLLFDRRR